VSQYIVLLLSRVREYYADRFAGEVTRNPDALATGLVKIACGLARAPEAGEAKNNVRMQAARSFGIFDPKVANALALAGAASGGVSVAAMEDAMKWDLWNPWAMWYELSSSHPLPAKHIKALGKQSEAQGASLPFLSARFNRKATGTSSWWIWRSIKWHGSDLSSAWRSPLRVCSSICCRAASASGLFSSVTLSAAKGLYHAAQRCFAALSMTQKRRTEQPWRRPGLAGPGRGRVATAPLHIPA
jgi:hypothetical protein